jgi:hypothetical protein
LNEVGVAGALAFGTVVGPGVFKFMGVPGVFALLVPLVAGFALGATRAGGANVGAYVVFGTAPGLPVFAVGDRVFSPLPFVLLVAGVALLPVGFFSAGVFAFGARVVGPFVVEGEDTLAGASEGRVRSLCSCTEVS